MFHQFPGWDEAPEGTTHFCVKDVGSPWLKVEGNSLYFYDLDEGEWEDYEMELDGHPHLRDAIVREIKPQEAALPNGLEWAEEATHFCYLRDGVNPCFFNANKSAFKLGNREWELFTADDLAYWLALPHTIARYGEGAKQAVKPVVRKPVGWWQ